MRYNFISNSYIPGSDSRGRHAFDESNQLARMYVAGNAMAGAVPVDQMTLVKGQTPADYRLAAPLDLGPVRDDPADEARVLASAGASLRRDAVDRAIIAGVRDRTGRVIDTAPA